MRILTAISILFFYSCDNTTLPKQKGYFAPEFYKPQYETIETICDNSFIKNKDSKINFFNNCNYEIVYNKINAKIYVNNIKLDNNFQSASMKFDEKIFNNSEYADQILTSEYSNISSQTFSRMFSFVGDTPSNIQYYITDSIKNFLSANLYFNSKPNYDSLLPYIHYIRNDIKKMIESFEWNNER